MGVSEWLPLRIWQPPFSSLPLSLSLVSVPFRHGQQDDEAPRLILSFLSFPLNTSSKVAHFPFQSTSWPVDQAMDHQMLLATPPARMASGQEATLQNKAPTEGPPLRIRVRSP